jgi:hypothetical protein
MRSPSPRRRLVSLLASLALGAIAVPALAAAQEPPGTCDDPLAVLTPTGSTGDLGAVAVTAQVLEQGVEGWAEVTWEAFEGTTIDAVTIVRTDGEEVRTDGAASGVASQVLELVVCGSTEAGGMGAGGADAGGTGAGGTEAGSAEVGNPGADSTGAGR